MKNNHRKDQSMWSSHITTNNSCRCQQFIFLTPDWLFSCNTITYSCRYNKGCFGHWTLGRYCLEITQANHCIVLYVQYPIANSCNAQSNLYWISYISRSISDVHRFEKTGDILQCPNTGFPSRCHEEMLPGSAWCFKLVCCVTSTNPKHYIMFHFGLHNS